MEKSKEFLDKQNEKFYLIYSWLKNSMPAQLFEQVSQQELFLIVDQLIDFDLHDYYCQISLPQASIVLCLDSQEALIKICHRYEERDFVTMHTFVSLVPPVGMNEKLCIACIFFEKQPLGIIDSKFLETISQDKISFLHAKVAEAEHTDLALCELVRPSDWNLSSEYSLDLFFVCKGVPRGAFLDQFLQIFGLYKIKVGNLLLTYISADSPERCLVVTGQLHGIDERPCWECADIKQLNQELLISRYFSMDDLFEKSYGRLPLEDRIAIYFLRSVACFVHQLLVHIDPNMYSLENVTEAFCYWPELGMDLFRLFCYKCDPYESNTVVQSLLRQKLADLIERQDTGKEHADTRRKTVLMQGLDFIDACLKTNFFVPNKAALAYRLDPCFLDKKHMHKLFPHVPYGLFFIYQRDFFGFHIRFQDLARGGLRTIAIPSMDASQEESPFIFSECYQLAWTQQKKNKDIPEGGSKGIVFLYPQKMPQSKLAHLYRAQRIFIESLLSLVNCDGRGVLKEKAIIDLYGRPEYLYLGPDENMHDSMIDWIAEYSEKIGYKPGSAFITSKTKTGINHKRYGVTSHGINVCMEEVLRFRSIDPFVDSFTVKMAGGPDGDVAGNQILNLLRYYPLTARLLSLIDVSGVIYDPQGLDLPTLKELFLEAKPIRFYPIEKLSEGGFLLDMHSVKKEDPHTLRFLRYRKQDEVIIEEWISAAEAQLILRSFVHRLPADVFIPAGGRPATLNGSNVSDFLDEHGVPTSKTIIEGANLYLTEEARKQLEGKGAIIIKDSSANKGGVICSSFEVLTSLSLTKEEYLANKEQIIKEILQKIEEYAKAEVSLILETHAKTGAFCSVISEKISSRIDLYSLQIRSYLEAVELVQDSENPLMACFFEYLLPLLAKEFKESLLTSIPDVHKKAIIAVWIASKVVYLRGLDWLPSIVDVLPFLCKDPTIISCPLT